MRSSSPTVRPIVQPRCGHGNMHGAAAWGSARACRLQACMLMGTHLRMGTHFRCCMQAPPTQRSMPTSKTAAPRLKTGSRCVLGRACNNSPQMGAER